MGSKGKKRGFSGLSDLVSDINGNEDGTHQKQSCTSSINLQPEPTHSVSEEIKPEPTESVREEPKDENTDYSLKSESVESEKNSGGSGWSWFFVIVIMLMIWYAINGGQSNQEPSNNRAKPATDNNFSESHASRTILTGNSQNNEYPPSPSSKKTDGVSQIRPDAHLIRKVQSLLTELDYNPGPVDGLYGARTASALKEYQGEAGLTQDGFVDEDVLRSLQKTKDTRGIKETAKTAPRPIENERKKIEEPTTLINPASSIKLDTFTRGSYDDDVLRIQGTPDEIIIHGSLDYEIWKYGNSAVNISTLDRSIINWDDKGNLKIKLNQGKNVIQNLTASELNKKALALKKDYEYSDPDKALEYLNQAVRLDPNYAESYNNRGDAWADKGDIDKAILNYRKAIELDPNNTDAYNSWGIVLGKKGNYDQAIWYFTKATELNPEYVNAYYNRGKIWYKKDNYDRALQDFTKSIDLDPNDADAYYNRGQTWYFKGNYDQAIQDFTKLIELVPEDAAAYYNRGIANDDKGNIDKAIQDYSKSIELDPNNISAYINRGLDWAITGNADKACRDWQKSCELGDCKVLNHFKNEIGCK